MNPINDPTKPSLPTCPICNWGMANHIWMSDLYCELCLEIAKLKRDFALVFYMGINKGVKYD